MPETLVVTVIGWLVGPLYKAAEKAFSDKEVRFRELFESTFHKLGEIHNSNTKTLRECIELIPVFETINGSLPSWYLTSGQPIAVDKLSEQMRLVKNHWSKAREEGGGDREQLRRKSQAILMKITSPEERRLLISVFTYFMYPNKRTQGESALDSIIEGILEAGPDAVLPSTALTIQEELNGLSEPDEILALLTRAKDNYYRRWSEVSYYYHAIWVKATGA